MNKLNVIFQQTLIVTVGILAVVGVGGAAAHITASEFEIEWYQPFAIIITGFLCALPTLLLGYSEEAAAFRWRRLRVCLHALAELAVVSAAGYVFHWFESAAGYAVLAAEYFAVYLFAWAASVFIYKSDERKINAALKRIQDSE